MDSLNFVANILQILNYFENITQNNNDRILQELQHQNKKYLEKILEAVNGLNESR